MPRESMTPRERWLAVMRRRKPDRVPMDYWATPEFDQRLCAHLGCADAWEACRRLHVDRKLTLALPNVGPARGADQDEFGCRRIRVEHAGGAYLECVGHPLADCRTIAEVERTYRWPRADDFDYAALRPQLRGKDEYPVVGGGSEPFLTYCELRGLAQAFRDLLLRPDLVAHCLDRLFDLAYAQTVRIYETLPGRIDFSYVAEDFGAQQDLLFSPALIRQVFIPRMRRMIELAHQAGVYVFCHSDGAIRRILPDLVDAGIDLLNPVQWRCPGMDRAELKRTFGGRVVFHGGMDNQRTLAFGSVAEVQAEVLENLGVLGAGGGYILAPCHNLQVVSPPENVVAMYAAGYEHGWM